VKAFRGVQVLTSYALFGVLGAIYIYLAYVSLSEPAIAEGKLQRICLGRSPPLSGSLRTLPIAPSPSPTPREGL